MFFAGRLIANLPAAWLVERAGPKWTAVAGSAALMLGSGPRGGGRFGATLLPARGIQGVGVALLATAGLLSVLRARPGGGAAMTAFNLSTGAGGSAGTPQRRVPDRRVWLAGSLLAIDGRFRVLLAGSLLARVRAAVFGPGALPGRRSVTVRQSRSGEVAAVAANLLVFVNYSIWVVSLPLLGAEKFGFDAGQVGLMLLFVNVVHLASAVPFGGIIRRPAARGRWLLASASVVPECCWCRSPQRALALAPMALYAIGQVAGNSSAGDLILHLGGGGGRAVGAVRLSSDIGLVAGPAAVGVLADAAGVAAPFAVLGVVALVAMATVTLLAGSRHDRDSIADDDDLAAQRNPGHGRAR